MSRKKIFIIDDEIDLAEMVQKILEDNGYEVFVLNTSKDAVETVEKEKPDLLLLDIGLPGGKDGYQICDEIKVKVNPSLPVIVFTAQVLEKDLVEEAHKFYGADDFLLKPFETRDLLEKVKRLTDQERDTPLWKEEPNG